MTAADVRIALRNRYSDHRRYAVAEEVGLTTGYAHRWLDMIVLDCYESHGFRVDGFEIKVSTSDLRRELEVPEKHVAFYDVIDYYTLVAPAGVVEPLLDIVPKKWGVIIADEDGSTRMKRKALALEDRAADKRVPRGFFASVVRAIQQRQPSTEELQKEYERGVKEAEEKAERHRAYMATRVEKEAAKLEEYDRMKKRFDLYGEKLEDTLDEFEAFRKLEPAYVKRTIKHAIERLTEMQTILGGETEGHKK